MIDARKYIKHIDDCFDKAVNRESKLPEEVHGIPGMTGFMTRCFYNNLLELYDARYLELGVWTGSSSCSAMYGNNATMVFMDDFSSFGGPREDFFRNFEKYKGKNDATFIEADCFKFDISVFKTKFNIYLYDCDHSSESHYRALSYYLPCMDDVFIYIVDDWNYSTVREGTFRAIKECNLTVNYSKLVQYTHNDEHTEPEDAAKCFWNGIAVFILTKPKSNE